MLFLKKGWSPVPARIRRCCCGNNGRTQTRAPFHTVRGKTFIPCPSSAVAEPNVTDLFKFLTLWTSGNNIYYCLTFANVTCQRQTQNQFPRPFRAVTIEGTRNFVANSFLVPYIFSPFVQVWRTLCACEVCCVTFLGCIIFSRISNPMI